MPSIETKTTITVGGVPEHFNSPWHIAIESGAFERAGLDVKWKTIDTGTGAMCKALAAGEIDVAVALTEGVVADIAKGGAHRILGVYIDSPLTWGVHVNADSRFQEVSDLRGQTFGVSRLGSGSHLMAFVQALSLGWDTTNEIEFAITGNLPDSVKALGQGEADAYMWEKFTTKPTVDSGVWRRIGEFLTPWPCFVATAATSFTAAHPTHLAKMMEVLATTAKAFKTDEAASIQFAAERYGLQPADAAEWFAGCRWHGEPSIKESTLVEVVEALLQTHVLSPEQAAAASPAALVSPLTTLDCAMPDVMYNWRVAGIMNALEARGKATGPLEVSDLIALGHLDQYHYLGTEACDHAAALLGLCEGRRVLDVGSGIGGPARYLASTTGCTVTGVELLTDLVESARKLTARVASLEGKVDFINGDCTSCDLGAGYDHFISLLVFLHVPGRAKLFQACKEALAPGGTFLIEDFYQIHPFTPEEKAHLREDVMATSVVSLPQYRRDLEAAGFTDIVFEELTPVWLPWTKARHEGFVASKEKTVAMHGEDIFRSRQHFYGVIDKLFAGGNLGGVKITGRKPSPLERSLTLGRQSAQTTAGTAKLNEVGMEVQDVLASPSAAVQAAAPSSFGVVQPSFPAGNFHDSLQYHFFCGPICIGARVFHTATLQHHSLWMHDERTGVTEELCCSATPLEADPTRLHLTGAGLEIVDGEGEGRVTLVGTDLQVTFEWTPQEVFPWEVPGQGSAVIHRPHMRATLTAGGETHVGDGYSKRYYGPDYGPCWGYRFIQGFAAPEGYVAGDAATTTAVWTADATFGENKYNYFKCITPEGEYLQAPSKDTWQQLDAGYAMVDGNRWEVEVETLGEWWSCMIENEHMQSNMQQRYCELRFTRAGRVMRGRAINERCFGTVV